MCLHQRGSKNGHCPCCKADASFSPSSHFPPPAPPRQQAACPCRSGPVHNPVRSQPGHICGAHGAAAVWERGNLAGGEGRSARPLAVQQCVAVQVQHRHNQQHWRISCSQMRKKKKKAISGPLSPRRTGVLLSLCQPSRGSSCSPPGNPAGPPSLRWELWRSCQRKGSLYTLLEMLYLPLQAEIPLIGRGLAARRVAHHVSVSSPKMRAVPLESGKRAVGSPLPCDGAGCAFPLPSCSQAGY